MDQRKTLTATELPELWKNLQQSMSTATGRALTIPPTSVLEMKAEYLEATFEGEVGKTLKARFPFDPRFLNPVGFFQGGMLATAFDNVLGPLSYLAFRQPCLTIDLSTKFVRPFMEQDRWVVIEAEVVSLSRQLVVMRARATTESGKLIALAESSCLLAGVNQKGTDVRVR